MTKKKTMKDTYYFSHDYNARTDVKIKKLIAKHSLLGYGVYWAIIEDLYQNANALQTDYDSIAYDLRVDVDIIKSVINNFDLFVIDGDVFGSLSVEKRLNERRELSKKNKENAERRWAKVREEKEKAIQIHNDSNANIMRPHSDGNTNEMQVKERKGKEKKVKENEIKETKENETKENEIKETKESENDITKFITSIEGYDKVKNIFNIESYYSDPKYSDLKNYSIDETKEFFLFEIERLLQSVNNEDTIEEDYEDTFEIIEEDNFTSIEEELTDSDSIRKFINSIEDSDKIIIKPYEFLLSSEYCSLTSIDEREEYIQKYVQLKIENNIDTPKPLMLPEVPADETVNETEEIKIDNTSTEETSVSNILIDDVNYNLEQYDDIIRYLKDCNRKLNQGIDLKQGIIPNLNYKKCSNFQKAEMLIRLSTSI